MERGWCGDAGERTATTVRGCASNGVCIALRVGISVFYTNKHCQRGAQLRQFKQRHECSCACVGFPSAECAQCGLQPENTPPAPPVLPVFPEPCFQVLGVRMKRLPAAAQQMSGLLACPVMLCRHSLIPRAPPKRTQAPKETSSSVFAFTELGG